MKRSLLLTAALTAVFACRASAATPAQEKAFVDSYRKALEAGDTKTLESFLYTKGATEETIGFFKMMMGLEQGAKIVSVELVKPDAEEEAKLNKAMQMPDGKSYVMPLKVVKQLVIKSETKSADGSSSGTSKSPVADKDGKLVIPVPVPAK
jgi:hypothetical protein